MNEEKRGCFEKLVSDYDELDNMLTKVFREYFSLNMRANFQGDAWKDKFYDCIKEAAKDAGHGHIYRKPLKEMDLNGKDNYSVSDMDPTIICGVLLFRDDFLELPKKQKAIMNKLREDRNSYSHERIKKETPEEEWDKTAEKMNKNAVKFVDDCRNFIYEVKENSHSASKEEREKFFEELKSIICDKDKSFNESYKAFIRAEAKREGLIDDETITVNTEEDIQPIETKYRSVTTDDNPKVAESIREMDANPHIGNSYTQINNNQSLNVNNVLYSNAETTVAMAANGKKPSSSLKRALMIIIPVVSVIVLVIGILIAVVVKNLHINNSKTNQSEETITKASDDNENYQDDNEIISNRKDVTNEASNDDNMSEIDNNTEDSLTSMKIIEQNQAEVKSEASNSLGNIYQDVLIIDDYQSVGYARYYLDGKFQRLVGTMSCDDDSTSDASGWFEIYLDDNKDTPVFSEKISRSTEETLLDIDVSGAKYLTLQLRDRKGISIKAMISDCVLYKNKNEVTIINKDYEVTDKKLTSMKIIEQNQAEVKSEASNSLGNIYQDVLIIDDYQSVGYARYYLDGKFQRLVGTMSCDDDSTSDASGWFEIYLDDNKDTPVFSEKISRSTEETLLDIDVSGAKYLTLQLRDRKGISIKAIVSNGMLFVE